MQLFLSMTNLLNYHCVKRDKKVKYLIEKHLLDHFFVVLLEIKLISSFLLKSFLN